MKEELAQETIKHIKEILKSPIPFGTLVGQMDKVIENYESSLEEVKEEGKEHMSKCCESPAEIRSLGVGRYGKFCSNCGTYFGSPKQKEGCCIKCLGAHWSCLYSTCECHDKQEVELPEMPEELPYVSYEKEPLQAVIENNRKTINKIIKYLKQ